MIPKVSAGHVKYISDIPVEKLCRSPEESLMLLNLYQPRKLSSRHVSTNFEKKKQLEGFSFEVERNLSFRILCHKQSSKNASG